MVGRARFALEAVSGARIDLQRLRQLQRQCGWQRIILIAMQDQYRAAVALKHRGKAPQVLICAGTAQHTVVTILRPDPAGGGQPQGKIAPAGQPDGAPWSSRDLGLLAELRQAVGQILIERLGAAGEGVAPGLCRDAVGVEKGRQQDGIALIGLAAGVALVGCLRSPLVCSSRMSGQGPSP
ncbi:hypothetical protein THUN1379_32190 [Paludibacterium sp. THUN1379]|uniref:hypothetical protein n=1 Tax=Paludibacterium sp. THUN1379 TaxID=3112107 RepID=UPI00308EEDE0|nr:hypothetical protein THUN1379_32190 [Paludibacterium sp. THUN1379]